MSAALFAALFAALSVMALVWAVARMLGGDGRLAKRLRPPQAADGAARVALRKRGRPNAAEADGPAVALLRLAPVRALDDLAGRAGVTTPIEHMVAAMAAATVAVFLVLTALAGMTAWLALALAPPAVAAGWGLGLRRKAARRASRFNQQLPEALALMARSLRVGHPISAALSLVSREMPDPLGGEMGTVFDEMTYGLGLDEALDNLCRRVDGRALRTMTVAIRIQSSTGGNLAELLDRLAAMLRDVDRMHRKVRALSAEGRLSAAILAVLPFAVAAGIAAVAPGYYRPVLADPPFLAVLWGAGLGMALGVGLIVRMVNFRF